MESTFFFPFSLFITKTSTTIFLSCKPLNFKTKFSHSGTIQRQTQNLPRETTTCLNSRKCSKTKKRRRHPQSPSHNCSKRDATIPLCTFCQWHFQRIGPIVVVHVQKSHLRLGRGETRIHQVGWLRSKCFCWSVASLQGVEFKWAVHEVVVCSFFFVVVLVGNLFFVGV